MRHGLWVAAGLFLVSAVLPVLWARTPMPPLGSPPVPDFAVQDVSMTLAGTRRFGGDLAFIQLLQYYGSGEEVGTGRDHEHAHGSGEDHSRSSWLPRFLPISLRVSALSPYFHSAVIFAAGSLGFVLDRPEEALALLRQASEDDPTFWRYRLYAGAIAYRRDAAPERAVTFLEEALKYPDCPSIIQNILANLHKKLGNYRRAAEIYSFTMETSRDAAAVDTARRGLERLREEGRIR